MFNQGKGRLPLLSREEASAIAARVDPFNSTKDGIDPGVARGIDGGGMRCYTLRRTARYTVTGGTNYIKGIAKMQWPNSTDNDAFEFAGSATGAAAPTACTTGLCTWDQASPIAAGTQFRVLGMAIRANMTSTDSNTSGQMRGGCSGVAVTSSSGVYPNYATHEAEYEPGTYLYNQGITVRFASEVNNYSAAYGIYPSRELTWYVGGAWTLYQQVARTPEFEWDGLNANSTMLIEAVQILEIREPAGTATHAIQVCPYSDRWAQLYATASDPGVFPYVTEGHSFSSFMKQVGSVFRSSVPYLDTAAGAAADAAGVGQEYRLGKAALKMLGAAVAKRGKKKTAPTRVTAIRPPPKKWAEGRLGKARAL